MQLNTAIHFSEINKYVHGTIVIFEYITQNVCTVKKRGRGYANTGVSHDGFIMQHAHFFKARPRSSSSRM
jgi:hypothetical protein